MNDPLLDSWQRQRRRHRRGAFAEMCLWMTLTLASTLGPPLAEWRQQVRAADEAARAGAMREAASRTIFTGELPGAYVDASESTLHARVANVRWGNAAVLAAGDAMAWSDAVHHVGTEQRWAIPGLAKQFRSGLRGFALSAGELQIVDPTLELTIGPTLDCVDVLRLVRTGQQAGFRRGRLSAEGAELVLPLDQVGFDTCTRLGIERVDAHTDAYRPLADAGLAEHPRVTVDIGGEWRVELHPHGTDQDIAGAFTEASAAVLAFAEAQELPRQDCSRAAHLDVFAVTPVVLNDRKRFPRWPGSRNPKARIDGLYDRRVDRVGTSAIVLGADARRASTVFRHEVAHYWFDRMCWRTSWKGTSESFARAVEAAP